MSRQQRPSSPSAPVNPQATVRHRHHETLRHALGPLVVTALAEPEVVEVMANPDGSLWADRLGRGRERIGSIDPAAADAALRLRPDRIVVGKVRGPEALALIKA